MNDRYDFGHDHQVIKLGQKLDRHIKDSSNPHGVTKAQLGLNDVENIKPADMPLSDKTKEYVDDSFGTHLQVSLNEETQLIEVRLLSATNKQLGATQYFDGQSGKIITSCDLDEGDEKFVITFLDGTTLDCDLSALFAQVKQNADDIADLQNDVVYKDGLQLITGEKRFVADTKLQKALFTADPAKADSDTPFSIEYNKIKFDYADENFTIDLGMGPLVMYNADYNGLEFNSRNVPDVEQYAVFNVPVQIHTEIQNRDTRYGNNTVYSHKLSNASGDFAIYNDINQVANDVPAVIARDVDTSSSKTSIAAYYKAKKTEVMPFNRYKATKINEAALNYSQMIRRDFNQLWEMVNYVVVDDSRYLKPYTNKYLGEYWQLGVNNKLRIEFKDASKYGCKSIAFKASLGVSVNGATGLIASDYPETYLYIKAYKDGVLVDNSECYFAEVAEGTDPAALPYNTLNLTNTNFDTIEILAPNSKVNLYTYTLSFKNAGTIFYKWDELARKEDLDAKPSGGGTDVEANPAEAATQSLTTIKIAGVPYNIPGTVLPQKYLDYLEKMTFDKPQITSFILRDTGKTIEAGTYELGENLGVIKSIGYAMTNVGNISNQLSFNVNGSTKETIMPAPSGATGLESQVPLSTTSPRTYIIELVGTDTQGNQFKSTKLINIVNYVYGTTSNSETAPSEAEQLDDATAFEITGSTFEYDAGDYIYLYSMSSDLTVETESMGEWNECEFTELPDSITFKQDNGYDSTRFVYRVGPFREGGEAKYRLK